jgi:hypothetical protein
MIEGYKGEYAMLILDFILKLMVGILFYIFRAIKWVVPILLISFCFGTWLEDRDSLNTPQKVADYYTSHVDYYYTKHATPYRQPEEILRSGVGGCTDAANFAYETLKYHGYTCAIYEVYNAKRGHAFCVVLIDGKYDRVTNYGYVRARKVYVREMAKSIYPDMTGYRRVKGNLLK